MTLQGLFRRVVTATVVLAALSYAIAEQTSLIAWLIAPAALFNHWAASRGLARNLPRGVIYSAAGACLAFSVFQFWSAGLNVTTFCEFLGLILLVKLWDRRAARDYSQILTLSVFLAIGSILTSQNLAPGLLTMLMVPALIASVIVYQVFLASERVASASPAGPAPTGLSREGLTPLPPAVAGLVFTTTAVSLVAGLAVSVAVFVGMPRGVGAGAFGPVVGPRVQNVTGFTSSVELRRGGFISESRQPVLDLTVEDQNRTNLGGLGNYFYLRGLALDVYEDGTWRANPALQAYTPNETIPGYVYDIPAVHAGRGVLQRIRLRSTGSGAFPLFAAWAPVQVRFEDIARVEYRVGVLTLTAADRTGRRSAPIQYSVLSVDPGPVSNPRERSPGVFFESQTVADIAREVLRQADVEPDPAARPVEADVSAARTLESFLERGFEYTLDKGSPPAGQDPIEWFLTTERRGNCEYFASAHAALCRSVGINARVIAGYVAAEFDPGAGAYHVRQSNAHAWTEVEVSGGLWWTFDPTPPASLAAQHEPPMNLMARVGRLFDSIEYAWINSVVSFDRSRQSRVFDPTGPLIRLRNRLGSFADRVQTGTDEQLNRRLGAGAQLLLVVLVLAGLVFAAVRLWPALAGAMVRRTSGRAARRSRERLPVYYQEFLRLLGRLGAAKPESSTPLDHVALALSGADAPVREAADRLVRRFYAVRFGGEPPRKEHLADIQTNLRVLRAAARAARPVR
jgi:transglutaminase-like putative cysteine protease